jgi:NADH:ubiquinone oxidoreductase subunit 6 (subunit J)
MEAIFLVIHIAGAVAVFCLVIASIVAFFKPSVSNCQNLAKGLGAMATIQLVSGAILMASLPTRPSLLSFCQKVGLYLAIIIATEFFLWIKITSTQGSHYPLKAVFSMASPGLASLGIIVIQLYAA